MAETFRRGTWEGVDNLGRKVEVSGIEYDAEYEYEDDWDDEGPFERLIGVSVELTGHDSYYVDDEEVEEDIPDYIIEAIRESIEESLMED